MTLSPEGAPRFRAVLFDLDGTLADCFQDIQAATNHALRALGLPEHDLAAIKTFVGHGVDHLCQMALGGRVELADEARRHIVAYYASHPASTSRFYEGIPELARDLRAAGVRVGVVSNKVHPLAVKAIEGMGGADWFDAIQGEVAELARKPSPEMLWATLEKLGIRAGVSAMVGDGLQDIQAARAAGAAAIAVAWGATPREVLAAAKPDFLAESAQELRAYLFGLSSAESPAPRRLTGGVSAF